MRGVAGWANMCRPYGARVFLVPVPSAHALGQPLSHLRRWFGSWRLFNLNANDRVYNAHTPAQGGERDDVSGNGVRECLRLGGFGDGADVGGGRAWADEIGD
jgi:hypothetical protein